MWMLYKKVEFIIRLVVTFPLYVLIFYVFYYVELFFRYIYFNITPTIKFKNKCIVCEKVSIFGIHYYGCLSVNSEEIMRTQHKCENCHNRKLVVEVIE